jgi:OmpA-OmpF porin, OOP family
MAINLLDLAKTYFTDAIVEKMAVANDTPAAATRTAIGGILPALLGGIMNKVKADGNANWLMTLLQNGNFGGSMLSNLGTMLTGSAAADKTEATGEGLINTILGDKADDVARGIASYAGVRKDAASGLMDMAAPVLMSVIGKQAAESNTGSAGLMGLITSQADHIKAALPTGLAALGGLFGLGGIGSAVTGAMSGATATVGNAANYVTESVEEKKGGLPGWVLPLLGVLAVLALLWFLLKGCENKPTTIGAAADSTANMVGAAADSTGAMMSAAGDSLAVGASAMGDSLKNAAGDAGNAIANAAAALGEFGKRKLPDGIELNIPANGIENKLIAFIEDKSKAVDKTTWFSFDRLEFATGKSTLLPKSQEQLTNIAAILKAYPNVSLKLGGYTDNTGSKELNMKLSGERAKSTMAELAKMGISAERLASEGYGPEHPVASNETAEGRQRNRRIDVRVTKK